MTLTASSSWKIRSRNSRLCALIFLSAPFGSTAGSILVEVTGYSDNDQRSETWCVFTGEGGERIPAILPAIAADMVLGIEIAGNGIVPLPDWITRDRLVAELAARGIRVVVDSKDGEPLTFDDCARRAAPLVARTTVC